MGRRRHGERRVQMGLYTAGANESQQPAGSRGGGCPQSRPIRSQTQGSSNLLRVDALARIEVIMADGKWRSLARIKKDARVVTVVGQKTTIQDISAADVGKLVQIEAAVQPRSPQNRRKIRIPQLLVGSKDDFEGLDEATGGKGDWARNP